MALKPRLPNKAETEKIRAANAANDGIVLVDPRIYHYRIKSADLGYAKSSKNAKLDLRIRLMDHPDEPVLRTFVMLEGEYNRWPDFTESCGWNFSGDEDDFVGLEGLCEIRTGEYNNRERSEVGRWLPPSKSGKGPKNTAAKPAGDTAAEPGVAAAKPGVRQPVEAEEPEELDDDESGAAAEAEDDLDMSPPLTEFNDEKMTQEEIVKLVQQGKADWKGEALTSWLAQMRGETVEHAKPDAKTAADKITRRFKAESVVDA